MLFNSYVFILLFLPIVLTGFYLIGKQGYPRVAISWLVAASLFFYGWWNPAYLGLILGSILFNYALGVSLGERPSKILLVIGVSSNLALLGFFKYANFFVENVNEYFGFGLNLPEILLPLAISFFTFQQIAYLVDAYKGVAKESNFLHYCLFVTFFPQLIAGPIVHHKEMLPQFLNNRLYELRYQNMAIGLTIFMLGLFKKVFFADNIAVHATPVFDAVEVGVTLTFFEAWGGALAYTLQLYFDFSGYSDMAIGLARMFGIILPINFFSPYKATSIIEFWRRWHITLSRFLRDYLYIPLGGNRKGQPRRMINVMMTMILGGLWHGAGWTFILWGCMHGVFLIINQLWRWLIYFITQRRDTRSTIGVFAGKAMTFLAVVLAWVMFRAESVEGALSIYSAMFGQNGLSLPIWSEATLTNISSLFDHPFFLYDGLFNNGAFGDESIGVPLLIFMMLIVWYAPNTVEIMARYKPALNLESFTVNMSKIIRWKFSIYYSMLLAVLTLVSFLFMSAPSEFLYFQF